MIIFKIVAIGILTTVVGLILKQQKPEFALMSSIAGAIIIFLILINQFVLIFDWFDDVLNKSTLEAGIVKPIFKIIGIGYVAEFASTVCEDSGNKSMSNHILLGGKITILILALPIIKTLMTTIVSIL